MDADERSHILFRRYEALRIYAAIARLTKDEFTTGEVSILTGVPTPVVSKELGRLKLVGLVTSVSRRGDYTRLPSDFWALVDTLGTQWEC
jgi:hypothetical protein